MPPSWVRSLQEHAGSGLGSRVPSELENADWSGRLAHQGGRVGTHGAGDVWAEGLLASLALPGEVCAMAVEPIMGYLAVATDAGTIHLYGSPAVQQHVSFALRPALKVKFLLFKPGTPLLVCIDEKDNMSVYDLSRADPAAKAKSSASNPYQPPSTTSVGGNLHPDSPARIAAYTARNSVICVEISPAHSHLFLGLRDGSVDCYDLERLSPSPYRVPNLGYEEEEIQRRSGVPDAPSRRHVPLVVDLASHPKNVNQLLLAYEGAVILLDIKERAVLSTYQLRLLPGAPGSGGDPVSLWTERAPPVTCIAWRPDGLVFAMGHEDGLVSFWQAGDDEKPLTVRSLHRAHVDRKSEALETDPAFLQPSSKEPIFKLAWATIPGKTWLDKAADAYGAAGAAWQRRQAEQSKIPEPKSAQSPQSDAGLEGPGTILTVLGGAVEGLDPPGLTLLNFAPYTPPTSLWGGASGPSENAQRRKQLIDSLETRSIDRIITSSIVEDFLLVPKDSPHYAMAYDPIAVITLLAEDPSLPSLPPPAAARGLQAYCFPPGPRSLSQPKFTISETLNLPYTLSLTGSGAVIGSRLIDVGSTAYHKLIGQVESQIEGLPNEGTASYRAAVANDEIEAQRDLLLRGGKACPTVTGRPPQGVQELLKVKHYRVIATWHKDGTIRFADASPHLLLAAAASSRDADSDDTHLPKFLQSAFPSPLPHLTISTHAVLRNPAMAGHPLFDRLRAEPARIRIKDVHIAPEVLEVGVALSTGQLLHFHFGFARFSETSYLNEEVRREISHDEWASPIASPLSPAFGQPSILPIDPKRKSLAALDNTMAAAMSDLTVDGGLSSSNHIQHPTRVGSAASASSLGPPPSRPPRDPKRLAGRPLQAAVGQSDLHPSPLDVHPGIAADTVAQSHLVDIDDITPIDHLADWSMDGFKPKVLVDLRRGEINAFAVSDVGFIAIAHGMALAIVDLRGPEILLRDGFGDESDTSQGTKISRENRKAVEAEGKSPIARVSFCICRTAEDPSLALRAIVVRESGLLTIWTIAMTLDIWLCERTSTTMLPELARPIVPPFIVDVAGNLCFASPAELQRSIRDQSRIVEYQPGNVPSINLLVGISRAAISVRYGVTGVRMSKADIAEEILSAQVIQFGQNKALVAASASSFHIFSLPQLAPITRLQRHSQLAVERSGAPALPATINFDLHGDLIEVASSLDVRLWTVAASVPRPGPPAIQLYTPGWLPPHPGAGVGGVASSLTNWFGKPALFASGSQLDDVLAGPKRPPLPNLPEIRAPLEASPPTLQHNQDLHDKVQTSTNSSTSRLAAAAAVRARKSERPTERLVAETGATRDQARLNIDAAQIRGEAMANLEEGLSSLERGAKDFLNSTRQNLVMGAAKGKITGLFK